MVGPTLVEPLAYQWRIDGKIEEIEAEAFPENTVTVNSVDDLRFTIQSAVNPGILNVAFFSGFTAGGVPDMSSRSEVECAADTNDSSCSYSLLDDTTEAKINSVPKGTAVVVVSAQYMTSSEQDLNDGFPSFSVS